MTMKRILWIALLCTVLLAGPALAKEKINVAVAANFITAFQEIALSFEAKTGISVEATYSSTGQLYAQIVNGAPYDLFLSADEERPTLLNREGRMPLSSMPRDWWPSGQSARICVAVKTGAKSWQVPL
jgi:molybdate transport system substrate-binding protein